MEEVIIKDYRFQLAYKKIGSYFLMGQYYLDYYVIDEELRDPEKLKDIVRAFLHQHLPPFQKKQTEFFPIIAISKDVVCNACMIGSVNHGLFQSQSPSPLKITTHLHLEGWAFDPDRFSVNQEIYLGLKNQNREFYILPMTRTSRPDIAKKWKNPDLLLSGFEVEGNVSELSPGIYTVHIIQKRDDGYIDFEAPLKIEIPIVEKNDHLDKKDV